MNPIKALCTDKAGTRAVMQGNIAFATGIVRSGIHAVDGYPGTPSTEVIDKGLSQVQDMLTVGWSVSEAVSVAVGHGVSMAGKDCVVTMKIPGLFQAGDPVSSCAFYTDERGALIFYIASDFTPSSTQHLVDPRPFLKSCFIPILEPRDHQEMHECAELAADISRRCKTPVAILASGTLCHSEGLVTLTPIKTRETVTLSVPLKKFNTLPVVARGNYDRVVTERLPALRELAESPSLNRLEKGSGKLGVITYGATELFVREVKQALGEDIDILSLGCTFPLPMETIRRFHESISGDVYVLEDGYRYLQDEMQRCGLPVKGKNDIDTRTEWDPESVAEALGLSLKASAASAAPQAAPLARPPMICAGCPYRLFGETVRSLKKRGKIDACFGDIGCNTLLFFMDAVDTNLAMGASEGNRAGYVLAHPDKAARCISLLGDSTECHSGLDATRNSLFRHIPGVKVILDNSWTAMTGGQPAPTSPVNLAGQENVFGLAATLKAHGAAVLEVDAYDRKAIRAALTKALDDAAAGTFTTLVVRGVCIRKAPKSAFHGHITVDAEKCKRCGACAICPGITTGEDKLPSHNNLCTGCAGQNPACGQMCPVGAIQRETARADSVRITLPEAPATLADESVPAADLPQKLSVAVRGVGGQGNLFFGRVLTQLAFLAGYGETNIVKGETHGMAQMGGPVISTFSCGDACSPVLLPGTADCLVCMEMSEALRPGFIDLLKPGGTLLLATTRVYPYGVSPDAYPTPEAIRQTLAGYTIIEADVLAEALKLGDSSGRSANVVMIGALSTIAPFNRFPASLWLKALQSVSPKQSAWNANYAAFNAGRGVL